MININFLKKIGLATLIATFSLTTFALKMKCVVQGGNEQVLIDQVIESTKSKVVSTFLIGTDKKDQRVKELTENDLVWSSDDDMKSKLGAPEGFMLLGLWQNLPDSGGDGTLYASISNVEHSSIQTAPTQKMNLEVAGNQGKLLFWAPAMKIYIRCDTIQ